MPLVDVYNRYNPAKRFARLLFRASQFVESAEANEQISITEEREKAIGDSAFGAISLREGGTIVVDRATGTVRLGASKVWAGGVMHAVPAATLLNVPMVGTVTIGVAVTIVTVSDIEDVSLKGIVTGTESDGESLGFRQRFDAAWARAGDPFYPIHTVVDGQIPNEVLPPGNDGAELAVERHVDETHGSHIVDGFVVSAGGFNLGTQEQTLVVSAGVLRAQGKRVTRSVDARMKRIEDPSLFSIVGETHSFPVSGGVVTLNYGPIADVQTVTVIKEKTVSLTHQLAGGADPLPDTVYTIQQVKQGAKIYAAGTYQKTGDAVDWSPAGDEPSPGSSYDVTYRYVSAVAPTAIGRTTITLATANVVAGLPVTVQYRYKLPRIDVLACDLAGTLIYLPGVSNRYNPVPPRVPRNLAPLARIENQWGIDPLIEDVDQRSMTEADVRALLRTVLVLSDQVSRALLEKDIQERDPASRRGYFVDPFTSDDQRDTGISQDAAIVGGLLMLPIDVTPQFVNIGADPILLPFKKVAIATQPFRTGSQKINEFLAFEPMPGDLAIDPAVDRWNQTQTTNTSSSTSSVVSRNSYRPDLLGTALYGTTSKSVSSSSSTSLVSRTVTNIENLRQIPIAFTATRFGPGETITSVTFDGIEMIGSVTGTKKANAQGVVTGSFVIPPNVKAGTKPVVVTGQSGSRSQTSFVGQGTLTVDHYHTSTSTTTTFTTIDPVAQTFRLAEPRILVGVKVEFTARGNPAKPVVLDLRPVENGLPTGESLAEGIIGGADFTVGNPAVASEANWTEIDYRIPTLVPADEERAFALLTDDATHAVAFARLGSQIGTSPEGFDPRLQQWVRQNPAGGVMLVSSNASTWLPRPEADVTHQLLVAEFTALTRTVVIGTFDLDAINPGGISDVVVLLIVEEPSEDTRVTLELVRNTGEVIRFEPNSHLELNEYLTEDVTLRMVLTGTAKLSPIVMPECQILWGRMKETASYVTEAIAIDLRDGPVKVRTVVEANAPGASTIGVDVGGVGAWTAQGSPASVALGDNWIEREYLQSTYNAAEARVRINLSGTPAARPFARQLRVRATKV